MTRYTEEHRARIVETYLAQNGSFVAVQRDFAHTFKERRSPSRRCIINMTKRYRESGTAADKGHPRIPKTV